jgi:hypothetical protein
MTQYFNIDYDELFGNDSGENEREQSLKEYFVDLPDFKKFFNSNNELGIVRARKGMGKSALLTVLALRMRDQHPNDIVITTTGNELIGMGDFAGKSQAYLENHWKQVICKRICIEIGRRIDFALTDNTMSMVEVAEIEGYKSLNILSALIERAGGLIQNGLAATGVAKALDGAPIATTKRGVINPTEALKSFQGDGKKTVWFLIDDIDAKYIDDAEHQQKVGAFFSALRSLAFGVSGLRLRASVRTDVWRNLRKMEDQDKLRQYVIDIAWKDDHLKSIFSKRILTYLKREGFQPALKWHEARNYYDLFDQVFWGTFTWNSQKTEPFIPLKFLAGGRPRWMGQLSKLAGANAGFSRISQTNILDAMRAFGQEKISDIQKEHAHQFSELDKLILSFRGGKREYNRYQLIKQIEDKFSSKLNEVPSINGYPFKSAEQLAEFLFEIDFLTAHHNGKVDYATYSDDPELFSTEENNQNKILWAIHSSYRNFLRIV